MAITNPILRDTLQEMEGTAFISLLINRIISFLLVIAVLAFLFFFILGALKILTSGNDKSKVEEGQHQLTYAFLGLTIIFCLFALLKVLGYFFGIEGLETLRLTWPSL